MQHQFSEHLRSVGLTRLCCALAVGASLIGCSASDLAATPAQPEAAVVPQPIAAVPAPASQQQAARSTAAALRQVLSRSASTVKVVKRQDGLTQIDTLRGFHSASVAHRAADGRLEQTCIHSAEELDDMMAPQNGDEP